MASPYRYRNEFLKRIRESGWRLEEISGLARIPLRSLYEICAGLTDPPVGDRERLALALGCEVHEIFPKTEGETK